MDQGQVELGGDIEAAPSIVHGAGGPGHAGSKHCCTRSAFPEVFGALGRGIGPVQSAGANPRT